MPSSSAALAGDPGDFTRVNARVRQGKRADVSDVSVTLNPSLLAETSIAVTSQISMLADQTNLLALRAAIETACAGGSVDGTEVGRAAEASQRAVRETEAALRRLAEGLAV